MERTDPPSTAVVRAIADEMGVDATSIRPLAEVIDADALDDLVGSLSAGGLTFPYEGFLVTVTADGRVEVEWPPDS